ncbi:MAG: hypothetical protein U1E17_09035 [Geminicoccaceae bacterium]
MGHGPCPAPSCAAAPRRARAWTRTCPELRILILLVAMLLFGLDDTGQFLSARYPTPQILFLRYACTIPLLLAVLAPRGIGRHLRFAPAAAAGRARPAAGGRDRARRLGVRADAAGRRTRSWR